MDWQFSAYVAILFLSLLLSLIVAYFALRLRDKPGGLPLGLLMLAIAEWSFALIFEATAATIPARVFWSKVEYLGVTSTPVFLLLFVLEFTHREKWLQRRYLTCYWIIPIISLALSFTNEWHHLIWTSFTPIPGSNFIIYGHGSWFWIMVAYIYLVLSTATILLLRAAFRLRYIYRRQAIMLFVGIFPPWLANILYVANLGPIPGCDLSPIGFALTGLLLVRSLGPLKLLDLSPVARDKVIENMRDGVLVLDAQNRIVDINPAAQELIGVDSESAIGRHAEAIFAKWTGLEDRYRDEVEAQGQVFVDGVGHIEWRISPLCEGERPSGQLIILRDITERKKMEEAIKESEERYRGLSKAAFEAIFISEKGVCLEQNSTAEKMFGYTLSEAIGRKGTEWIAPKDREMVINNMLSGYEEPYEATALRKDGSTFPAEIQGKMMHYKGRTVRVTALSDITARKRAEEALRESEGKYRTIYDNAQVGLYRTRFNDGKVLIANKRMAELWGYESTEDCIAHGVASEHYADPGTREKLLDIMREHGKFTNFEARITKRDGTIIWLQYSGALFPEKGYFEGVATDITERVRSKEERARAEESLRESEERLDLAIKGANLGMWDWNVKTGDVTYSERWAKMLGYELDELAPDISTWETLVHPEDKDRITEILNRHFEDDDFEYNAEFRFKTKSSGWRWINSRARVFVRDEEKKPLRMVGTHIDITERKRAEAALRESEEQLRNLIDAMPDFICFKDGEGRWLVINDVCSQLFRLEGVDYRGKKDSKLAKASSSLQNTFLTCKETDARTWEKRSLSRGEEMIPHPDGTTRTYDVIKVPIFHPDGSRKGLVVLGQDITERKLAEEALRESEEFLRQVIDTSPNCVFVKDWDGKYILVNKTIAKLYDTSKEQMVGKTDRELAGLDRLSREEAECFLVDDREVISKQQPKFIPEELFTQADGTTKWFQTVKVPLTSSWAPACVLGVAVDITERKRAEEALQVAHDELEQRVAERTAELSVVNAELVRAARMKDEFLANMSHELRTPLNAILGMSETLWEEIHGPLNEKQLKSVRIIESGGRHLLDLINDILDVAKIESGMEELEIAPLSVEAVCLAGLRLIKQQAHEKQIGVSSSFDSAVTILQADARRLKQILVNLLSNAVKFTPEGGTIGLEVVGDTAERVVHFTVWDTGIGIAEEDMARLFEPFVQLDSSLSRQYTGTGLGLALVSRLAEMHGGSVTIESPSTSLRTGEVGKGSRFTISLPWKAVGDEVTRGRGGEERVPPSSPPLSRATVLLAEDNEINAGVVSDYLEAKGYRVIVARDGAEAIERAREERPDVILMDMQMPGMDGLEATRRLRSSPPQAGGTEGGLADVPIIALTALTMFDDRERFLEAGVNMYLSKPVRLRELVEAIEAQLAAADSDSSFQ